MRIGVPKEVKSDEYRVGLIPSNVRELNAQGHEIWVETQAGMGIDILDADYEKAGAKVVPSSGDIFDACELIVKVKEPQPQECKQLSHGQTLFTYLHLAPDPQQAQLLLNSGCCAIAYETVTDSMGRLPLLTPMSEVAGRMAIQAGAHALEKAQGGRGVLLGGVPGVAAAKVVVIGGGVVGSNALRMAIGMEAQVTVLDKSLKRLGELDCQFGASLNTVYATSDLIDHYIQEADLVVGAVLIPGGEAPKLLDQPMLKKMRKGAVLVDVAIDQGGCFETSRPTTHSEPTYVVDDIVHYCVTNMPGAAPRTSTFALNNATLPFVTKLANQGIKEALLSDPHLLNGLNIYEEKITHHEVARALNLDYTSARAVLEG